MFQYGKNFWLVCFSMFLFMASFNLILPDMNDFITILEGAHLKGLIITLFTISSAIARPFSGKLADLVGRKKVMIIGMGVTAIVSLIYPLSFSVLFFLFLRFLHGFSAGFFPTGATALLTDIMPSNKRGVGMGIWGTFVSLGIGAGQSLGSLISKQLGLTNLFMIACGVAILSGILVINVKETLEDRESFSIKHLKLKWNDIIEPSVFPSAVVMFLTASCSGIIFVLSPDISNFLKIENKGWFFIFYVLTTIIVRLFLSSLSDRIGRRKTLLIGITFLIASMLIVGSARDVIMYTLGSIIFGIATGISSPTLFAWTADLSHPKRRGVGAGTLFIALEAGIFLGSILTLITYDNDFPSVFNSFLSGSLVAIIAFAYLVWHLMFKSSAT